MPLPGEAFFGQADAPSLSDPSGPPYASLSLALCRPSPLPFGYSQGLSPRRATARPFHRYRPLSLHERDSGPAPPLSHSRRGPGRPSPSSPLSLLQPFIDISSLLLAPSRIPSLSLARPPLGPLLCLLFSSIRPAPTRREHRYLSSPSDQAFRGTSSGPVLPPPTDSRFALSVYTLFVSASTSLFDNVLSLRPTGVCPPPSEKHSRAPLSFRSAVPLGPRLSLSVSVVFPSCTVLSRSSSPPRSSV